MVLKTNSHSPLQLLHSAMREEENRLRVLELNSVDLSAIDAEVLAKEAAKMSSAGSVVMYSQGWEPVFQGW